MGPLVEPQIGVDDARRALKPGQNPQPPAYRFVLSSSNPVGGGCSKSQDSSGDDLDIDLPALLAFADQPQVPGKDRDTRNRKKKNVRITRQDQTYQCKQEDRSIDYGPKACCGQVASGAASCPGFDRDRDRLWPARLLARARTSCARDDRQ